MKIIIIEDERLTAEDLAATIRKLQPATEIIAMLQSVQESLDFFSNSLQEADLIFSDIQLGDGTSFDIFSQVDNKTPVIFCTAFDEYALDAFKANGIDYLLKPFNDEMVQKALKKFYSLKEKMAVKTPSFDELMKALSPPRKEGPGAVLVYSKDKILPVAMNNIAFFFVKNVTVHLTTFDKKTYYLNKSLDEVEKMAGPIFFRVNRQYLVNRKAVTEASNVLSRKLVVSLAVPAEEVVLISKEKMPQFLTWLTLD